MNLQQKHIDQILDSIKDRNLDEDIGLGLTRRKLLDTPLEELEKVFAGDVLDMIDKLLKLSDCDRPIDNGEYIKGKVVRIDLTDDKFKPNN